MWLEPETQGEFDVAVGAVVKSTDGSNICLVDDDKKVSIFPNQPHPNQTILDSSD